MKAIVVAISKNAQFIWTRTSKEEDKWVERLFVLSIDSFCKEEWVNQNCCCYITEAEVDSISRKLAEIGFKVVDGCFPII